MDPKYITKTSVEQKVGPVHGWQELLSSVGFHVIEHVKKEVPPMIFFPDHDDSGMQRKCRRHIESLLGNNLSIHAQPAQNNNCNRTLFRHGLTLSRQTQVLS